ncbi:MAG: DUF5050 domain-containing protein [Lachnospiraceae bacterium]|nr:DUF5050 domain-containing protein [Lachnospiraceae bacterium]
MNKLFSNKKLMPVWVSIGILVFFLVLLILLFLNERVTKNPPGTVGNTAGNLNNGGYFCEYNGKVYFSNAYDKGALYSMDVSEENIKKLNTSSVCNILAGGDYLYYFQTGVSEDTGVGAIRSPRSFNRCRLNGKSITSLTWDTVVKAQLVDNYLYLMTTGEEGSLFYKMKTDKSDRVDLASYDINPASVQNGIIYYNGTQIDHYLYSLNTANDVSSEVWAGNLWYPIVEGDYVYYLDVANNYRICRYSFSQGVVEVLTNDRADCFNVGHGYIYYQKNGDEPQLICMRTDGSERRVVMDGTFTDINMTSKYVYFRDFWNENSMYHSPLGYNGAETFRKAIEAAADTQK